MLRKPSGPAASQAMRRRLAQALVDPQGRPLAEAARQAGFSVRGLFRAASQVLGEAPAAHARRHRLDAAALALLRDDRTILEIALELGFRSHETFTRAFRRRFGMTPSAFRQEGVAALPASFRAVLAFARHAERGPARATAIEKSSKPAC